MKIIAFSGRREDTNNVKILKDGGQMMTFPRARVVRNAIDSLSGSSSQKNISNLLDVAANNQYGLRANSALRSYLNDHSPLSGTVLENNNWDLQLQEAITKAVSKLPKNKREAFLEQQERIFNQPLDLTPTEQLIIKDREEILNSKPIQEAAADESKTKDVDKAVKYLDYFVASSETPMKEKEYVLSKLSYMLSDDYAINPQLKDKKFQVFSEVINDLVIQVPGQKILTTKDCDQMRHGSCGAISQARKALLYEDKPAYIDVILSELDDKPYMEVYDVTRLSEYEAEREAKKNDSDADIFNLSTPKVKVEKAQINYDRALFENYRIIDASTLHWMKIADTVGDGTISLSDYFAFDNRHKGLLHDSHIVKIADKSYASQHAYLRTLIKSRDYIKSYEKAILKNKIKDREALKYENDAWKKRNESHHSMVKILKTIVPNATAEQLDLAIRSATRTIHINFKNNDEVLTTQIVDFLSKKLGEEYRPALQKKAGEILPELKKYEKHKKASDAYSQSVAEKSAMQKKLFQIGVAQREIVRRQLKWDNSGGDLFFDDLKKSDYVTQLRQHVKRLEKLAQSNPNSKQIADIKARFNFDDAGVRKFLADIQEDINVHIPDEIDTKLAVYNTSYKQIVLNTLKRGLESHRAGDYWYMHDISNKLGYMPDTKKFGEKLERICKNIEAAKNQEEINKSLAELGAHNESDIVISALNNLTENINSLLLTKGLAEVNAQFGGTVKFASEEELWNFVNTNNSEIEQQTRYIEIAANLVNFPTVPDLILKQYEAKGEILSENVLDNLKEKFDDLDNAKERYAKRRMNGEDVYVPVSMFQLTTEQKTALEQVRKSLPKFKRIVTREYIDQNKMMKDKLDELYKEIGQRKGHFWVGEEGHSGLMDNEMIRIMEQMTGRPYYSEKDIDKIVDSIKSGKGVSSSSTNVSYDEYSGHAQYIADVREIDVKDPKTGNVEKKDVLLHDNSWGRAELRGYFVDKSGNARTNYGNKYGGNQGFILTDELLAGSLVDEYRYAYGQEVSYEDSKAIDGPSLEIISSQDRFRIFNSARMQGIDPTITKESMQLMKYLFNISHSEKIIDALFQALEKNDYKINLDNSNNAETILSGKQTMLLKRLGSYDDVKFNPEDYDKLAGNDPLKVIIAKQILRRAIPELNNFSEIVEDKLSDVQTMRGLENFKTKLLQSYKADFDTYLSKKLTPEIKKEMIKGLREDINAEVKKLESKYGKLGKDFYKKLTKALNDAMDTPYNGQSIKLAENLTLAVANTAQKNTNFEMEDIQKLIDTTTDSTMNMLMPESLQALAQTPNGEKLIKFIESKFNPVDDDDLISTFFKLTNMPQDKYEKIMASMTFEDIGIKFENPEKIIKMIQIGNASAKSGFNMETRLHYFDEATGTSEKKGKTSKEAAALNTAYWNILASVSGLEVGRYVKDWKEDAFKNYGARSAVPDIKVRSDEQIIDLYKAEFTNMINGITKMKALKTINQYLTSIEKINEIAKSGDLEKAKNELIKNLEIVKNLATVDGKLKESYDAANSVTDKYENDGIVTKSDLNNALSVINNQRKERLAEYTLETTKAELANTKRIFTHNIEYLVRINVLPRYQEHAKRLIHNWVKLAVKNVSSPDANEALGKAIEDMTKHFILKEPDKLLGYVVERAAEKKKYVDAKNAGTQSPSNIISEEMNDRIVNELKNYLTEAYHKSNRAELEFKLMSLAAKGQSTKVRDVINKSNIKLIDTEGGQHDFFSEMGMGNVINALSDIENNNSTLLLFIEQAGLVKDFLETIYKNDPKSLSKLFREKTRELVKSMPTRAYISNNISQFLQSTPVVQKPSKEIILALTESYLDKLWENKGQELSKNWLEFYSNQFRAIVGQMTSPENVPAKELLAATHAQCISMYNDEISSQAAFINDLRNGSLNRVKLLNSVRIAPDSEEDRRRSAYNAQMEKVLDYADRCGYYLNIVLNQPPVVGYVNNDG